MPPPGWYPDPRGAPGQSPLVRYWDGAQWTDHTAAWQPVGAKPSSVTPDGEPLADYGQRVGAFLIDSIAVGILGTLIAFPWVLQIFDVFADYFRDAVDAAETGRSSTLDAWDLQVEMLGPLIVISLIGVAVGFVYHVGFLMWRQATPGKLMLGLRVRRRDAAGPMPLRTVLLRWLAQFGPSVLGAVPVLGWASGLYPWLDNLWPLADDKRQALHDKAAGTNVVRRR